MRAARERLALVCLLGIALYLVKVVHDAPTFTFSDELVHAFNVERIRETGHLFHHNPILRVTPFYPGFEGATSALVKVTGLSTYAAGTVLVGVARLTLIGGLFLLFERLGSSARTAGLAAAIYTTNFNFLFWGAQFSYESLALPLLVVVFVMVVERERSPGTLIGEWAAPLVIAIAAIVVTHHLTSYALFVVLVAARRGALVVRPRLGAAEPLAVRAGHPGPDRPLARRGRRRDRLLPLQPALGSGRSARQDDRRRVRPARLFQGGSGAAGPTPIGARIIALLGVALLFVGWVFGIRETWRRYREQPWPLLFMLASLGFFAALGLRLAPAAWETGNRASEFFFIGLAFVIASAGLTRLSWPSRRAAPWLLTAAFGVVLVGGVISGWPWDAQLTKPLRVSAEGRTISSPPMALAEWAKREGPEGKWAAATADANLLLVPGGREVTAGTNPDVEGVLKAEYLRPWQTRLLSDNGLRYVVADQREVVNDGLLGYFFPLEGAGDFDKLLPEGSVTKFGEAPGAARIYDNGPIAVYDMEDRP